MASLTAHAVQALATESTAEFVGDGVSPGALSWLTHMVYGVLTWVTITVPTQVYSFLSLTVTLTFHFKTILIAAALFLAAVYGLVRYYFLTVYSRLPKPPAAPDGAHEAFDLHPDSFLDEDHVDTDEPGPKSGSFPHDFLSVFLSSIQIFGYLEQPVFHELARHLQTRRLLAGETMFYDDHEDRSFYMVVDGSVQVYLKPEPHRVAPRTRSFRPTLFPDAAPAAEIPAPDLSHSGTASYEDLSGAVPAPALGTDDPLVAEVPPDHLARESSQTEAAEDYLSGPDVSPSDSEDDAHTDPFDRHQLLTEVNAGQTLSSLFTILSLLTDNVPLRHRSTDAAPSRVASTASLATEASGITTSRPVDPFFPGLRTEATQLPTDDPARPVRPVGASRAVHPDIIARASVDTTLAVIPVEAFHRLNKKYPNASAHIVQVILTRLQRATFMILHNYLGAHQELHALERAIMQSCHYRVPPALASALSLNHLRAHFLQARVTTDLIPGATFTRNSKVAPHASRTPALRSRFNAAHQNSGTGVPSTPAAYATGYCGRAGLSGLYTPTTTTVAPTAPTEFPFHLPGRTQPPMPFSEFEKGLADASRGAATTSGPAPDFLAEPLTLQAENFSGREAFDAVKDLVLESMFLSLGLSRVPTVAGPPARTMSPMNPSSHLAWRTAAGAPKSPLR
ncbi:phosphatidylcholine and lysophosphatidylcholine phospholipase, partial [Tieghemiomyces parasiticus]